MKFTLTKRPLVNGLAAIAIATGAMVAASSAAPLFAQGNEEAEGSPATEHAFEQNVEIHEVIDNYSTVGPQWDQGYIDESELLANALDITIADLEAAYEKALELAIAQAVTDGELTQAQADDLLSAESDLNPLEFFATDDEIAQYLAQALSLTQEEFDAAIDGAIQKAADDGLLTQAQANEMLLDKLIQEKQDEAYLQALDAAVAQDLITQPQADRMREQQLGGLYQEEHCYFIDSWESPNQAEEFFMHPWDSFGFAPGNMDEEIFEFDGPGGFYGPGGQSGSGGPGNNFEEDFEFFIEPGQSRRGHFRMPNFSPFR